MIEPAVLQMIRTDWMIASATRTQSKVIRKWAEQLGCSYNTLYRRLGVGRKRKGARKIGNIEDYALIVAQIKKRPPKNRGEITTEDAIEIAVGNGLIPSDMRGKKPTFDRVMRELGLSRKKKRVQRFQAEWSNEMHHVDASSSDAFYIWKANADDCILRLHKGSNLAYKNKPVPVRLRPWIYGIADDHSGLHRARYIAAEGENAIDNLEFIMSAWSEIGLPEKIKGDFGPMMRGPAVHDFFQRLSVDIDPSEPMNKDAHGKIERPWRTMWQRFELPFFVEDGWEKFEITLSELNRRFSLYQEKYNQKPHRYERRFSRDQIWRRDLRGGIVAIPENALGTIAKRFSRKVDQAGCLSIDNECYEVKGLHDAEVWVYWGIFDDRMIVQDKATGEKYEVETFVPNTLGEFSAPKDTAHDKAVKSAPELKKAVPEGEDDGIRNTLYTEPEEMPENVVEFPIRTKEVRQVADPLDTDAHTSLTEAMSEFVSLSGIFLEGEDRDAVADLILEHGMSRTFVRDLALEVSIEQERSA